MTVTRKAKPIKKAKSKKLKLLERLKKLPHDKLKTLLKNNKRSSSDSYKKDLETVFRLLVAKLSGAKKAPKEPKVAKRLGRPLGSRSKVSGVNRESEIRNLKEQYDVLKNQVANRRPAPTTTQIIERKSNDGLNKQTIDELKKIFGNLGTIKRDGSNIILVNNDGKETLFSNQQAEIVTDLVDKIQQETKEEKKKNEEKARLNEEEKEKISANKNYILNILSDKQSSIDEIIGKLEFRRSILINKKNKLVKKRNEIDSTDERSKIFRNEFDRDSGFNEDHPLYNKASIRKYFYNDVPKNIPLQGSVMAFNFKDVTDGKIKEELHKIELVSNKRYFIQDNEPFRTMYENYIEDLTEEIIQNKLEIIDQKIQTFDSSIQDIEDEIIKLDNNRNIISEQFSGLGNKPGKMVPGNHAISNIEINDAMKGSKIFRGSFMRDMKYPYIGKGKHSFIINTDFKNGGGIHWLAVYCDSQPGKIDSLECYDPFGEPFPDDILKRLHDKTDCNNQRRLKENLVKNQDVNSMNCGRHCLKFIQDRESGKSFVEATGFKQQDNSAEMEKRFNKLVGGCMACNLNTDGDSWDEDVTGGMYDGGALALNNKGFLSGIRDRLDRLFSLNTKKMPKGVRLALEKYGDWTFNPDASFVCRKPIRQAFVDLGNLISYNELDKALDRLGYDGVMHLYSRLRFEKEGKDIDLFIEKNEMIKVEDVTGEDWDLTKCIKLPGTGPNKTLLDMFTDGEDKLGGNFWRYSLHKYNCQNFLVVLLDGYLNEEHKEFIMQDVDELFKSLPEGTKPVFQFVTDLWESLKSGVTGSGNDYTGSGFSGGKFFNEDRRAPDQSRFYLGKYYDQKPLWDPPDGSKYVLNQIGGQWFYTVRKTNFNWIDKMFNTVYGNRTKIVNTVFDVVDKVTAGASTPFTLPLRTLWLISDDLSKGKGLSDNTLKEIVKTSVAVIKHGMDAQAHEESVENLREIANNVRDDTLRANANALVDDVGLD